MNTQKHRAHKCIAKINHGGHKRHPLELSQCFLETVFTPTQPPNPSDERSTQNAHHLKFFPVVCIFHIALIEAGTVQGNERIPQPKDPFGKHDRFHDVMLYPSSQHKSRFLRSANRKLASTNLSISKSHSSDNILSNSEWGN